MTDRAGLDDPHDTALVRTLGHAVLMAFVPPTSLGCFIGAGAL